MSREAYFTLDLSLYSENITDIIAAFNNAGWGWRDEVKEYLPLHDDDMFDYQEEQIPVEQLFSVIERKQECGELCGVRLYHRYSDRGIVLLAKNTKEVMVSIDINRKLLCGDFTDISWYVENIAAKLDYAGCTVFSLEYHEYIG